MATKIPVTVITGFLGSGKTTLIRHVLQNNQGRRIAVLVNEFGELGIDGELLRSCQICPDETTGKGQEARGTRHEDAAPRQEARGTKHEGELSLLRKDFETDEKSNLSPLASGLSSKDFETNEKSNLSPLASSLSPEIVELTNGCLCCTVQEEFLPTMQELLKRRDSLDCILIETSGLALPKPLVQAFRWHEIRNAATVDAVVTVVDCAAVAAGTFASDPEAVSAQRQADENLEHETPLQELFEDQLACADLVVLNKTDLVDKASQAQVVELIQQELPRVVKMVTSDRGILDPSILLGFQAAVEDNLSSRPSHHDTEEEHDHDDEITSTHLILNRTFEPTALEKQLQLLAQEQDIYRIKGFVAVPNKPMRLVLQGVGTRFDRFYDRPWQPDELKQTRLVFIGQNLNPKAIESQLVSLPE